jgi:hypothetical protein
LFLLEDFKNLLIVFADGVSNLEKSTNPTFLFSILTDIADLSAKALTLRLISFL